MSESNRRAAEDIVDRYMLGDDDAGLVVRDMMLRFGVPARFWLSRLVFIELIAKHLDMEERDAGL